jgi:cohesin complex subunit SA-1/2
MSHSSPTVLKHAVATIQHLSRTTSLANTNALKILELEDELATSVRQLIAGREELDIVTFTEDEVHSLSAFVLRLHTLYGVRDMTGWMEEDDGGKVTRLVDTLSTLTERGRLGYKEEEMVSLVLVPRFRLLTRNVVDDKRVSATACALHCMEGTTAPN